MKIVPALSIIFSAVMVALPLPPLFAMDKTVTLNVPTLRCATCPITVKKAMFKVKGVSKVITDLDKREVVVTFDDAQTTVDALAKVLGDAGYPSRIAEVYR